MHLFHINWKGNIPTEEQKYDIKVIKENNKLKGNFKGMLVSNILYQSLLLYLFYVFQYLGGNVTYKRFHNVRNKINRFKPFHRDDQEESSGGENTKGRQNAIVQSYSDSGIALCVGDKGASMTRIEQISCSWDEFCSRGNAVFQRGKCEKSKYKKLVGNVVRDDVNRSVQEEIEAA